MVELDQSGLAGKTRDRPISKELADVLVRAARVAGVDRIYITSGGQPGSNGRSTGSTRHNHGRAADFQLFANGICQTFSDAAAGETILRFVTAAAAHGATGIGAGEQYMGNATLHVGFGRNPSDNTRLVWGAGGRSVNAPSWLRQAAKEGWENPPAWAVAADGDFVEDLPEEEDVHEEEEFVEELPTRPAAFSGEVIRAAQASQHRWGVPASVTLAQWALESNYGKSMPPGSNNPFGIKAGKGQPTAMAFTTEVVNGKHVRVKAGFRVFNTLEEAFVQHGELLGTSHYYKNARRYSKDADRFADALTGIYATDPHYGEKLRSIMQGNNLYQFDAEGSGSVGTSPEDDDVIRPLQQGNFDSVEVEALQRRLTALGYKLGAIDGDFGSLTAAALLSFQFDNGLPTTGVVDVTTRAALNTAKPRRLSEQRVSKTEQELVRDGSRIATNARRNRALSWIAGIFGALGVGNSAIVNAAGEGQSPAISAASELLPLLNELKSLGPQTADAELIRIADAARSMSERLDSLATLPPEAVSLLGRLREIIPQDALANNSDLERLAKLADQVAGSAPNERFQTIFDILPTFFADGTILQTTMAGGAAVANSLLPGFGGSIAILVMGLAGRYFSNRIAAARVEDHQTASDIGELRDAT